MLLLSLEKETEFMQDQLVKWHLNHCGLIIVHPFLGHLFKILEYVDVNNQFNSEDQQYRAVQLLYFIATGDSNFDNEVDLAMSKVLCGMTIDQVIPTDINLTSDEIKTAEDMLMAIIEKWEKLGTTSPDGLRQTFLQRDGILEDKDSAYQLTIESSGVDVLLDFIPWNINMIKLPWMDNLMYISWR